MSTEFRMPLLDKTVYTVFGVALLLVSVYHESLNPYLNFNSELILQGQYWRAFTGHMAHLNLKHGLMNVLGFWTCCYFFNDVYKLRHFFVWWLVGTPLLSACMLLFDGPLSNYVGLSGMLYGWLMFAIIAGFLTQPKLHLLGFIVLAGRITWEQTSHYDTHYLLDSIGGVVYVNAHFYGTLIGTVMAVIVLCFQHFSTNKQDDSN
ncbi:MAG TPA: rhombosortase [Alcanivoracaceae bacterium]|nr:rhombosortase [Alcanivoracaceae bacterium]